MIMMRAVYSLTMLKSILDGSADPYPFYSILLYNQ
jgi:hypothetical protein